MFLKSLKLTNFRNYEELEFIFLTPITVLIGNNAQGKTNFLESVYFLATTKSLKADADIELILEGKDFVRVSGQTDQDVDLEIAMQQQDKFLKKRILVNGVSRRVLDYCGNLAVVCFQPEDINLVTGSPSLRRYFIDQTISQVDKEYKKAVSQYDQVITRKNKVLKGIRDGFAQKSELTYWVDQQILLGNQITKKRQNFFVKINLAPRKFGEFKFQYLENQVSTERLQEYQDREIASSNSLIGPHRDDFLFMLDEKNLAKYGSRGEQRTAVLDLKLSQLKFMEEVLGDRPILLLDDIFSELDVSHRQHVVDISKMQQTIIATVEFDKYLKEQFRGSSVVTVEKGLLKS